VIDPTSRLFHWIGQWGRPPDLPAKIALGAAALCLLAAIARPVALAVGLLDEHGPNATTRRRFVTTASFVAAFLSLAYVAVYLGGGPRIVDATAYWLQGRTISRGMLSFPAGEVSAELRGRFLVFHDGHLAGIFPPGYPLLLALGFLLGAPMVIGPVLAAGLVVSTWALGRELARDVGLDDHARELVGRVAGLLSVVSAALRYHTADTMSHGAAALGVALAVLAALVARREAAAGAARRALALFVLAGLAGGWVLATRLASGAALLAVVALVTASSAAGWSAVVASALGALPGVALLCAAQRAATGSWLTSTQLAYYAQSDGPPGCFRWGFGAGIGCQNEHGEFVAAELPDGFGLGDAARITLRRLYKHGLDVANLPPLALLALVPVVRAWRAPSVKVCAGGVLALILVYVPFYFDGSFPGGGVRFYADALPLEHALVALGVYLLAPSVAYERKAYALLALALAGFGAHAVFEHKMLAERDGAAPMYDVEVLRRAYADKGVVFFDTDHGWNLAFDPKAKPDKGIVALRARHDDHDRVVMEKLERSVAYTYKFSREGATLMPWSAPFTPSSVGGWLFEAEAELPPLAQERGWAAAVTTANPCASGGRVLALRVARDAPSASVEIEVPVPAPGDYTVTPRVASRAGGKAQVTFALHAVPGGPEVARWSWADDGGGGCRPLDGARAALGPGPARLRMLTSTDAYFDAVDLVRAH